MLVQVVVGIITVCILIVVLCTIFIEKFIFFPSVLDKGWTAPAPFEELYITTPDGETVHALYSMPKKADKLLLWCHGNAGNVAHRIDMAREFIKRDVGIMLFDYRGYGKSTGTPTEQGVYKDAEAVNSYLRVHKQITPDKIIIFGKSLGGAIACELASKVECKAVILQSTFSNLRDMVKSVAPIIPAYLLVGDRFDSLSKIQKIVKPKLHIHSLADEIVPYRLGLRLFAAAPEPKELYTLDSVGHNETYLIGEEYFDKITNFIKSLH